MKNINILSNSMVHYLYQSDAIARIFHKYKIKAEDRKTIEDYTFSRIAGFLTLHMANDHKRMKDIINHYYTTNSYENILPEIEGYIDTKKL